MTLEDNIQEKLYMEVVEPDFEILDKRLETVFYFLTNLSQTNKPISISTVFSKDENNNSVPVLKEDGEPKKLKDCYPIIFDEFVKSGYLSKFNDTEISVIRKIIEQDFSVLNSNEINSCRFDFMISEIMNFFDMHGETRQLLSPPFLNPSNHFVCCEVITNMFSIVPGFIELITKSFNNKN